MYQRTDILFFDVNLNTAESLARCDKTTNIGGIRSQPTYGDSSRGFQGKKDGSSSESSSVISHQSTKPA